MSIRFLDGEKAAKHIINQLDKHHIPYTPRGNSVLLTCPYHPSQDSYPSLTYHRLSVNIESHYHNDDYIPVGLCRCWSCGKICFFNDLITNPKQEIPKEKVLSSLKPIPRSGSAEDDTLFYKPISFDEKESDQTIFTDVPLYWREEWKGTWRTITEDTLKRMGCYSYFDYNDKSKQAIAGVNRLLFYAYDINKEKVGWLALADDKARKKKYCLKQKNMDGSWVHKTLLFHEKFPDNKPIVLTEGPFDALRMIQEGFNAVSMLGAGSWSEEKKLLLVSKASHVIVLFDGDEVGYEKSLKVYKALRDYVPTKRLLLPILGDDEHKEDNIDPGNMPSKFVKIIRKKVKQFVEEN